MARPKKPKIENICKMCSTKFYTRPSETRKFCSKSCAQKYKGVNKEWLEKRKKTCLEKYGEEVAFKSKKVQDKYKENLKNKYGVENPFLVEKFKKKARNTIKEKYGVDVATQNKEIANKVSKSLKGRVIDRRSFGDLKWEKLLEYQKVTGMIPLFNKEYLEDNKLNHKFGNKFKFKCDKCTAETDVYLSNGYLPSCSCSNNLGYSLIEDEVVKFILEKLDMNEIFLNRRDIIPKRLELDIYLPNKKTAIEVNGVYWHSESMGKYRDYHLYKTLECEKIGVDLIHMLDYEWLNKKDIIKSIISNKLGFNTKKIYGRKTKVKLINNTKIVKEFLNFNHIQGYTHASINLGLYEGEELVSVMTFSKNRFKKNSKEYEMVRFCNKINTNVIGGASKLFKYFNLNLNPQNNDIISFADRRFFNGSLYEKLGFEFEKNTTPSYIYWKENRILNRMSCQKHKLSKLLDNFDPQQTEYQNMSNNGFRRVWDCGNIKFKYKKKVLN